MLGINRFDHSFSFCCLFKYISGKISVGEKNPEKRDINSTTRKVEGTKMSSKLVNFKTSNSVYLLILGRLVCKVLHC